jgi:hypothetical protein
MRGDRKLRHGPFVGNFATPASTCSSTSDVINNAILALYHRRYSQPVEPALIESAIEDRLRGQASM